MPEDALAIDASTICCVARGVDANHKKVYRLYRDAALSVRKRRRRKGVMIDRQALYVPTKPNEIWSIDFVMDALASGRRIKCLTIVDDFTRECLDIAVDYGISGGYVGRAFWKRSVNFAGCRARSALIRDRNSPAAHSIVGLMAVALISS
jgi:putative transposase